MTRLRFVRLDTLTKAEQLALFGRPAPAPTPQGPKWVRVNPFLRATERGVVPVKGHERRQVVGTARFQPVAELEPAAPAAPSAETVAATLRVTAKNLAGRILNLGIGITCGRCMGTGQHSRNAAGQTHCYGCKGRGTLVPSTPEEWAEVAPRAEEAVRSGLLDRYLDSRRDTVDHSKWHAGLLAEWGTLERRYGGEAASHSMPFGHPGAEPRADTEVEAALQATSEIRNARAPVAAALDSVNKARERLDRATAGGAGSARAEEEAAARIELRAARGHAEEAVRQLGAQLRRTMEQEPFGEVPFGTVTRRWAALQSPEVRARAMATAQEQRVHQGSVQRNLQLPQLDGGEAEGMVRDLAKQALGPNVPGRQEAQDRVDWLTRWNVGQHLLPIPPGGKQDSTVRATKAPIEDVLRAWARSTPSQPLAPAVPAPAGPRLPPWGTGPVQWSHQTGGEAFWTPSGLSQLGRVGVVLVKNGLGYRRHGTYSIYYRERRHPVTGRELSRDEVHLQPNPAWSGASLEEAATFLHELEDLQSEPPGAVEARIAERKRQEAAKEEAARAKAAEDDRVRNEYHRAAVVRDHERAETAKKTGEWRTMHEFNLRHHERKALDAAVAKYNVPPALTWDLHRAAGVMKTNEKTIAAAYDLAARFVLEEAAKAAKGGA